MNPWLDIPEADYVGHMSSPDVDQYRVLNRLLRDVLEAVRPHTLLVLGCSAGNGRSNRSSVSSIQSPFAVQAGSTGLQVVSQRTEMLSSGKAFEVFQFRRESA